MEENKNKIILGLSGLLMVIMVFFIGRGLFFSGVKDGITGKMQYPFVATTLAEPVDGKLLLYDGKVLHLVSPNGKPDFKLDLNSTNYSISSDQDSLYVSDGAKKIIYILDKKGTVLNQANLDYLPRQVVGTSNNGFVVHYFTDVFLEGVRLYSSSAKVVKDIQLPGLTITKVIALTDGGFMVCGINKGEDKLISTIYYYNAKGEYLTAVKLDSMVIMDAKAFKDKVVLMDPDYLILMDNQRQVAKKFYSVSGYQQMLSTGDKVTYLDKKSTVRTMDYQGKVLFQKSWDLNLVGFFFARDKLYVYDRDTLYGDKEKNYVKEELLKVVPLGNAAALITPQEIEFIKEIP